MTIKEKKLINAILFFANKNKGGKINRLKLLKLLWIADRLHLNRFGRQILPDKYYALPHGPVPTKTKDYSYENIEGVYKITKRDVIADDNADERYFSKTDIAIMNEVWEKYGNYNKYKLKDLSHEFPEWKRYEEELKNPDYPNSYKMEMEDFFKKPEGQVKYDYDSEESEASRAHYHYHSSIQDSLS